MMPRADGRTTRPGDQWRKQAMARAVNTAAKEQGEEEEQAGDVDGDDTRRADADEAASVRHGKLATASKVLGSHSAAAVAANGAAAVGVLLFMAMLLLRL